MSTKHEGRTLTLAEAVQLRRRNITDAARDVLDTARLVLDSEDLPDGFASLGVGVAQVILLAEGMEARQAIRHSNGFFFQEREERMALLAIRDAADRLLTFSARVIDAEVDTE